MSFVLGFAPSVTRMCVGSHECALTGRLACDRGTQGTWTNEESVILSEIWKALGPALKEPSTLQTDSSTKAESARTGHEQVGPVQHVKTLIGRDEAVTGGGSCYCYCGYSQAIGQCFNHTTSAGECSLMKNSTRTAETIGGFCARASLMIDCFNETAPDKTCPASIFSGMELDSDRTPSNCSTHAAPTGPLMQSMACHYKPVTFDTCIWTPADVCVDSPYFPLST